MLYLIKILVLSLFLIGCSEPTNGVDQCMRNDLFIQCLKTVPKGPDTSKYNDWDEVVKECQNASYYHSLRSYKYIKLECRSI
jgi:hypothetical protein